MRNKADNEKHPRSRKCIQLKMEESNMIKHGVKNTFQLVENIKASHLKKRGVTHHFKIEANKLYGKKNPAYKNGACDYRTPEWKIERANWRNNVFHRDTYKCQCCGNYHNTKLNAHHIMSVVDNKDKMFDIDNGITLCKKCHTDFHREYGWGYNNKEQLKKFLDSKVVVYRLMWDECTTGRGDNWHTSKHETTS